MKPADKDLLLRLQRSALNGDYEALLVARDLQLEHGVPHLTPAEEVGVAAFLALGKARRLPDDRGDARAARRMRRRATLRLQGTPLDAAERRYLHELLHANQEPQGPYKRCYAHPYRDEAGKPFLHESVCACWRYRDRNGLLLPLLRGEAGDTLTTEVCANGFFPQKIIIIENGQPPEGATELIDVRINNVSQFPAAMGGVDSRLFSSDSLGSGVRMDYAAPGACVMARVHFRRACACQIALFGDGPPTTHALNFAGITVPADSFSSFRRMLSTGAYPS